MRVFIIAGEPSGDKLGAALMAGLIELADPIIFEGVGGPLIQEQGLTSRFDMSELSIMGIVEILPKYRHLKMRVHQTAQAVLAAKPDVLITIDSPEFCLRVAQLVKASSTIRTVHYVAPSVWAWRTGRAKKMARSIDQVLALLPFEPPYMEAAGMRCDFVGHPIVAEHRSSLADADEFRAKYRLLDVPIILALPGSRQNEVARLAPLFGDTLRRVIADNPNARVVVPAVAHIADLVGDLTKDWPGNPLVLDPRNIPVATSQTLKATAFKAADVALAASGTVSLELAAAGTPMVIAYDMNRLSWQIKSRLINVDTVTLVNLVSGDKVVPEFLGPRCRPEMIAPALDALLSDPNQHNLQLAAMAATMTALGQGGANPGLRAAKAVLSGMDRLD